MHCYDHNGQFVLSKVLLYLYYLERLYIFSWAQQKDNTGIKPSFLGRLRCLPWLCGIIIFVFGVPCASRSSHIYRLCYISFCYAGNQITDFFCKWRFVVLLGFSREFSLLHKPGQSQAVGCHVFLKWYLATPVIGTLVMIQGSTDLSICLLFCYYAFLSQYGLQSSIPTFSLPSSGSWRLGSAVSRQLLLPLIGLIAKSHSIQSGQFLYLEIQQFSI